MAQPREVLFRIRRFEPGRDATPRWEEHKFVPDPGMTVLDGLRRLKETVAPTLSWRSSCRMGVCGSCGMFINGIPRLACHTQIAELQTEVVTVAPLPDFDIIRDLVPDLTPMFDAHQALRPFLIREDKQEQEKPTREYKQTPHQMEQYLQFSYCIKCGCCMAGCPTYATDPNYAGPMPLTQAYRYIADTRDQGLSARRDVLSGESGPWRCHFAGECSKVCPKGVDPAKAIQLLRKELVFDGLGFGSERKPAPVLEAITGTKRPDIPAAPARTIKK